MFIAAKGNIFPHILWWRRGKVEVQLYLFLTSALVGGEWSASRSGRFTTHPYPGDNACNKKNTYNFYLAIEVPDHVYVFYAYRLYFADKDIYMIRYFCHKIEII